MTDAAYPSIHACCVAIGSAGVLIRGPSGSGKSTLALQLILDAPRSLPSAELVADDRVLLHRDGDGLVARAPDPLARLMEVRGLGVRRFPCRLQVRLTYLVDLGREGPRLPDTENAHVMLEGVPLRHIVSASPERARLLLATLFATADCDE
ncbi:HPr kinase/phosphatase C-terminal domain-containing protein [Castellaniella sp.]|uniref:HPr kinase/phosphorylase n=1 Tax=Castellaniella sp. TaxID=1955812 RepID=UPI002AFE9FC7|nr:HPr kinase/phosphatase C-terminal domain-containing protein [Castellaniella sp.]